MWGWLPSTSLRKRQKSAKEEFNKSTKEFERFLDYIDRSRKSRAEGGETNEPEAQFPLHTVPQSSNPRFYEREHILQDLESSLQSPPHAESSPRSCLLYGTGGIGKTQTAVQYAHRAFERKSPFDCIFWISAEIESELIRTFGSIADELSLDGTGSKVDRAMRWVEMDR